MKPQTQMQSPLGYREVKKLFELPHENAKQMRNLIAMAKRFSKSTNLTQKQKNEMLGIAQTVELELREKQ